MPDSLARSVWTKEECLLAIWVYHLLCDHPHINRTGLYRVIAQAISRSENAVAFKVQNVSACDPSPTKNKPISEMEHKQELLLRLFREHWPKRAELDAIAEELLSRSRMELSSSETDSIPGSLWQKACDLIYRASEREFEDAERAQNHAEASYYRALRAVGAPTADRTRIIKGLKERLEILHYLGTEHKGPPRVQRVGQDELHKLVFAVYLGCCALCETRELSQLVTSHIVGWAEDEMTRLDPTNAILLCRLHDGLFDKGLIGFTDDMRVVVSSHWDVDASPALARAIDVARFRPPSEFAPNEEYLARHRKRHLLDSH